jgi:hypothetical protein
MQVLHHRDSYDLDNIINDVATAVARLMGRDLMGPPLACAVSLEMIGPYALTKAFPRSSCVVEAMDCRFASSCNTCTARFPPIFNDVNLTT